ncbi:MAG: alpha/beta hydrolase fold domain-containing protein [Polyangiaceae bacterium]|nr:alpha/beta hydrolase fold domain-containing protein [Polyangiaceae bacterium]MCW5788811.1 alpha/beta hydrolase fold domain-containing protein [Polyangiaceae bacterium]
MALAARLVSATLPLQLPALRRVLALPPRTLRRLAGGPHVVEGLTLAPQLALLTRLTRALGPSLAHGQTPESARALSKITWKALGGEARPMRRVHDTWIPSGSAPNITQTKLRARLYTPHGAKPGGPALLWLHGGGWVLGDIDTHDKVARRLADDSGVTVCSVEYRLAPEHHFPTAPLDAIAAFRWLGEHAGALGLDPARLAVGGDSAGGNLSAVVCQALRHEPIAPALQLLLYPGLDFRLQTASVTTFSRGYLLEGPDLVWFRDLYFGAGDFTLDPLASPGLTEDLTGLAPAHIYTAGFDVLRDEGRAYAKRLGGAGVPTVDVCFDSLVHGFANLTGVVPDADEALHQISRGLGEALNDRAAQ